MSIVIIDDSIRESVPECFTVSIASATGEIDTPSVATVCINDNDGMFTFGHTCMSTHMAKFNMSAAYRLPSNVYPYICAALSVTVGMLQTAYTVGEVDGYQLVCFGVLSGDIDEREIVISYTTVSGTAST